MATDPEPFQLSDILSELYHSKDLLDLSSESQNNGGPTSPGSGTGTGGHEQRVELKCVDGYGNNLYVGRSDGVIEWWTCDGSTGPGSSQANPGWTLRNKHTVFPRRPISRITLLPQVSRCFALSEGTIHPLSLPFLEPLPSTVIAPMRGVVSVILDDDELEWAGEGSENNRTEMTVVMVRRRGLGIYRMGGRMVPEKEIPLPSPPTVHALASNYLCACLPHSGTYALIDFSDASLTEVLPVSQVDPSQMDFDPNPNVAVISGEGEFLVTSYTGVNTMGVFLNGQGDPVRGTIEWPEHPLYINVESGFIIALLRNNTVHIHSLEDLERPLQIISLDPSTSPFALCYSPYGVSIRNLLRDERITSTRMLLLSGKIAPSSGGGLPKEASSLPSSGSPEKRLPSPPSVPDLNDEPPSGSGLTPPSSPPPFARQPITPQRSSSLLRVTAPSSKTPFSTTVTETLIVGPNGLQAVAPTSAITKLEMYCKEERTDDAIAVVDEEKRKGRRGEIDGNKAAHQVTMRFLHLYLACHLLTETRFEAAGDHLYRGKIDPRLVVRLFTRLRGKTIGSAEEVDIFEGLKEVLSEMSPIEDIIAASIKRNYSPHVHPDTAHAPETIELRIALEEDANAMLTEFLRKTRTSRRKGGGSRGLDSAKIDMVIDTTLAKLLAEQGTTNELLALLAGPNDVVLNELEPFLEKRPYILSTVMRQQGKIERTLQILKSIAESEEGDPLCEDPVDEIAQQLDGVTDPELLRHYALWLIGRDPEKGLAILMSQTSKYGIKLDDEALFEELKGKSREAANQYLEHAVVQRRSPNRSMHEALLERLLDQAEEQGADDGVKYHLEELEAEFRLRSETHLQPYCVFLADVAPPSSVKTLRLKLQLFLQGSPFYALPVAAERLSGPALSFLKYEQAIVFGRLGKHTAALRLLGRDIGDSISAQTYCLQGGEVIPPKVAHTIAAHVPELAAWATLGDVGRKRKGTGSADPKTQNGLVMDLLGVYMKDGPSASKRTATLLNAQSLHLDPLEVLALIPPEWPLETVSTFFQRSLRRGLHEQHTWQILKSIAAGQNLALSEQFLDQVTALRPTIVDTPEDNDQAGQATIGSELGLDQSPVISMPDEGSIPGDPRHSPSNEKAWSPSLLDEKEREKRSPSISSPLSPLRRERAARVSPGLQDGETPGSEAGAGRGSGRGQGVFGMKEGLAGIGRGDGDGQEGFFRPEGVVKELADINVRSGRHKGGGGQGT